MAVKFIFPASFKLNLDKQALKTALRESVNLVRDEARRLIASSAASGREYGAHRASAPGEAPATDSGVLASRIKTSVGTKSAKVYDDARSARGSGAPYGKFLETGAQGGGGNPKKGAKGKRNPRNKRNQPKAAPATIRVMEPRPYLSVAFDKDREKIGQKIKEAAAKGIKTDE